MSKVRFSEVMARCSPGTGKVVGIFVKMRPLFGMTGILNVADTAYVSLISFFQQTYSACMSESLSVYLTEMVRKSN